MHELLTNPNFWTVFTTGLLIPIIKYYNEKTKDKTNSQHDIVVEKIDKIAEKQEIQGEATKNIIRYRLIKNLGYAIDKGYTTSQELQEMVNLYESYKSLGGNGVVDKIYGDFTKLRIDDKKEE